MTRQQLLDLFKRVLTEDRIETQTLSIIGLDEMNLRTYGFRPFMEVNSGQLHWRLDSTYKHFLDRPNPYEELRRKMHAQGIGEEFEAAEVLVALERPEVQSIRFA